MLYPAILWGPASAALRRESSPLPLTQHLFAPRRRFAPYSRLFRCSLDRPHAARRTAGDFFATRWRSGRCGMAFIFRGYCTFAPCASRSSDRPASYRKVVSDQPAPYGSSRDLERALTFRLSILSAASSAMDASYPDGDGQCNSWDG